MEDNMFVDAMSFINFVNMLNIDRDFNELYDKSGKENYEMIVKRLREIELPDIDKFIYSRINFKEMLELLEEILNKILGNSFHRKIKALSKKIVLCRDRRVGNGRTLICCNGRSIKVDKILVSADLANIEVVDLAHEYMHALLSKYIMADFDVINNIHYDELISILIEYIVCYELSKMFKKDKLVKKNTIQRLDSMKRGCNALLEADDYMYEIGEFVKHTVFGYVVSDVYATRLYELYKNDRSVINKIRSILSGQSDIDDLINYYDLSLKDGKTVDTFVKKIDKYDNIRL